MSGLNVSIEYSFMTVGHTKFSCDRWFGVFKKKVNRTPVHSIYDIGKVCDDSGKCNESQLGSKHDGEVFVKCFYWAEHLSQYFKKVANITDYHHFKMSAEEPGVVTCSVEVDSEPISFNLLRKDAPPFVAKLPDVKPIAGLSPERQAYLYNDIREFVKEGSKDLVAPLPSNKRTRT